MLGSLFLLLVSASSAAAANLIHVESKVDGRTYLIDVDSLAIRNKLYSVAGVNTSVSTVPAWLLPYAGAAPTKVFRSAINGETIMADFQTGGTMRQVADYYDQLLRSRQFQIKNRSDKFAGQISVQADNGTESAAIRVSEQNGAVQLHVTYGIRRQGVIGGAVPKMQLVASTYDDTNGILYLRDQLSGKDFYLRKRAIVNEDYNQLEEHQLTLRQFPDWLVLYPGATVRRPVHPCPRKLGEPPALCASLETTAHPNQIWEFYEDAVKHEGFSFYKSGTNLDILASDILTVRVEVFHTKKREKVRIDGNRMFSKNVVLHMKWSQLPPLIDIPDPDEETFEDRVRKHRSMRELTPQTGDSDTMPQVMTPSGSRSRLPRR